ncbi:hypothetical protein KEM54_006151 [Ascosphaera aggregata]|nr:hypothetical protein KEM54_006151 [Ascosphaera aggregata]
MGQDKNPPSPASRISDSDAGRFNERRRSTITLLPAASSEKTDKMTADLDIEKANSDGAVGRPERPCDRRSSATLIEPSEEELERLGKARPEAFRNVFSEAGFVFAIVMSQILTEFFVSGFNVLLPTLVETMNMPAAVSVWPASSFSLVVGATLLFFGRIADMIGGYPMYIGGLFWLVVWSIITGFSKNTNMLIVCRAIQGFGPAMYLPSGVMLLSNLYRPGKRKNIVFSVYATCGCLGFFYGILISGISAQFINWKWYFWLGAISGGITLAASIIFVPSDVNQSRQRGVKMDWWGSLFIVSGLALVVFGLTQSAHAARGWREPYVSVLFVVGWILLGVAFYIEGWVARHPLMPFEVFRVKYMKTFTLALWFFLGCSGIFLFYGTKL